MVDSGGWIAEPSRHTHTYTAGTTNAPSHTHTLGPSADRWEEVGEGDTDSGSRSIVNSESV